jgi:hypothetical protein
MRRFTIVGTVLAVGTMLGVLAPAAGSTAAWADGPQHVTSTFSGEETVPAGMLCDFDYHNVFSGTDDAIIFPDKTIEHIVIHATHTNLATGYTLTETDHVTDFTAPDGLTTEVGIQWHLRTADGQVVVVHAGRVVFNPATGEILSITPNLNPDFAAVICPALGGQPAS